MAVNLILQDVNDNLPRFQLQNYVTYMHEAQGYDFPILQVRGHLLFCTSKRSHVIENTLEKY